jgi:hypothetical protein
VTCRTSIGSNVNISGQVEARPIGLNIGGKITVFTIDDSTWWPLPATALANRNALSVQNTSGSTIKINYDNTTVGWVGVTINSGSERFYSISENVILYAKAAPASGTITIQTEELA